MSKKPKTEKERREAAELKAQEHRAAIIAKQQAAEEEAKKKAQKIYQQMWEQFSADIEKGKSFAYGRLLTNLTAWASRLVPFYMTAKEHMTLVSEAAENSKGEGKQSAEDPRSLISSWLRGEEDLSRIKLDKAAA